MKTNEMIIEMNSKLHDLTMTRWLTQDLFSAKWWALLGFIVFSYTLCFWLLDKKRLTITILYGSLISVFSVVIDVAGSSFNLWAYLVTVIPIKPSLFIYDITALPLFFMLIFQRANSWKKYVVWMLGASALMGFIFTPLMVAVGVLKLIDWSYFNAFLTIFVIGIMGKAVTSLIIYINEKYKMKQIDVLPTK
jgi:hypothetical protein